MDKKSILIVEDERIVAEDIKSTLENLGYDVAAIASTGLGAIRKVEETSPDLILMDIMLGGEMDGIDAAKKISSKYEIPVVYLTAYCDEEILERATLTTPYGYIIKPFSERELQSNIEIAIYKSDTEKKLVHLNAVLAAIRGVNKLITHERERDTLLQEACNRLTQTKGYFDAFIMVLDEKGEVSSVFESGLGDECASLIKLLGRGEMPKCTRKALDRSGIIAIEHPYIECKFCPLLSENLKNGRLVIRLEKNDRTYGLLSVSMPDSMVLDEEEQSLFEEVAGDIAFALFSMELEEKRRALEVQLIQSEKLAGMGTLAAGVAHEINNPLQVIMGMTEIIMEDDDIDQIHIDAADILTASERIGRIVKNLTVYSREAKIDTTKILDLHRVIQKSIRMARYSKKFLNVELKFDTRGKPQISANPGEIQQIFVNLITNAVDAMHGEGILEISTDKSSDMVLIRVSDTGDGIPEENVATIFEPFFTTKEVGKGTGLGLYVIHQLVEKYGGMIDIESEVGKGTTFTLMFPNIKDGLEE